jgi:hypothetical protein
VAESTADEAATQGSDEAAQAAGKDATEAGENEPTSCPTTPVGGRSFTATTKVLLADGKAVSISSLKPGEKDLATNTKTGKNQAETITAVMVHHDHDLYDLKVRAGGRTAVIDTTRNHLFWAPDSHRWIKAAALKYGAHLRTPPAGTMDSCRPGPAQGSTVPAGCDGGSAGMAWLSGGSDDRGL